MSPITRGPKKETLLANTSTVVRQRTLDKPNVLADNKPGMVGSQKFLVLTFQNRQIHYFREGPMRTVFSRTSYFIIKSGPIESFSNVFYTYGPNHPHIRLNRPYMADHIRFSIQQPPFGYLLRRMFSEDAFLNDVSRLASISEEQRVQISEFLRTQTFADIETLQDSLENALVVDAAKIATTLSKLSSMFRESDTSKDSSFDAFIAAMDSSKIEEQIKDEIQKTVRILCVDPQSLDLQQKAERLATATGSTIDNLEIVTDIRPIFTIDGDKIVGAIPYFTLRIEYDDGESKKVDLHLSDENIDRLKVVVDRAICKRAAMEQAIKETPNWSKPRI